MPKKKKVNEKMSKARLWALFGIGFMVLSSIAYAVLSNPFSEEPVEEQQDFFNEESFITPPQEPSTPVDTDFDGLSDTLEREIGSNPYTPDTAESLQSLREELYRQYINNEITLDEYNLKDDKLRKAIEALR